MDTSNGICMGCMNEIGNQQICPSCGFDNSAIENGCGLPVRTTLAGRYIVGKVLESGGDGITYIGREIDSGKTVRIREFFPQSIAERNSDGTVSVATSNAFAYNESLINFIELAKALITFRGNDNLLDVIDIFEAGGTAFYITENISGITLREFLLRNGGQLSWEQMRGLIGPVMQTLSALHESNIIHGGISPETLLVGRDGKVRIIGFSIAAARKENSSGISARLFPGFAAIEQYGFDATPGPWTDVYGLSATIFRTLIGNPPPEATERISNDSMAIPSKLAEEIPKNVLSALAGALQITPEKRTKTIEEFKNALLADYKSAVVAASANDEKKIGSFFKQYGVLIFSGIAVVILAIVAWIVIGILNPSETPEQNKNVDSEINSVGETIYINEQETVKMPDFTTEDQTYSDVVEFLKEHKLSEDVQVVIAAEEYNDSYARGTIYKQEPAVGEDLTEIINIYISRGPKEIEMPNFVKDKKNYQEAYIDLLELGFYDIDLRGTTKLNVETEVIYKQEPAAGTKINPNEKITLHYYKESVNLTVVDFTKLSYYNDVKDNSEYDDYTIEISTDFYDDYPRGKIISQSIPAGTSIKNDQVIRLQVSLGPYPPMPNIVGKTLNDAKEILKSKNLTNIVVYERYDTSIASGKVIETNPSSGATAYGTITIYVSKGAKPVESSEEPKTESNTSQIVESSSSSSVVSSQQPSVNSSETPSENAPSEETENTGSQEPESNLTE